MSEVFAIEVREQPDGTRNYQSVFPVHLAEKSEMHSSIEDALGYIEAVAQVQKIPLREVVVCLP